MVWYTRVQCPTRHSIGHFGDGGFHFQGQKVKGQLAGSVGILWRPPAQLVQIAVKEQSPLSYTHQHTVPIFLIKIRSQLCAISRRDSRVVQNILLPGDAMRKYGLCCRLVSVRPSVSLCLSRWCILSTWLKISPDFFLVLVAP